MFWPQNWGFRIFGNIVWIQTQSFLPPVRNLFNFPLNKSTVPDSEGLRYLWKISVSPEASYPHVMSSRCLTQNKNIRPQGMALEIFRHEPVSSLAAKFTPPYMEWSNSRWAREIMRSWDQVCPVPKRLCGRGRGTWLVCAAGHWQLWSEGAEGHGMFWHFHSGSQRKKLYCERAPEMQNIRATTVHQK